MKKPPLTRAEVITIIDCVTSLKHAGDLTNAKIMLGLLIRRLIPSFAAVLPPGVDIGILSDQDGKQQVYVRVEGEVLAPQSTLRIDDLSDSFREVISNFTGIQLFAPGEGFVPSEAAKKAALAEAQRNMHLLIDENYVEVAATTFMAANIADLSDDDGPSLRLFPLPPA